MTSTQAGAMVRHIVQRGQVRTLFQPIVSLQDRSVVGYEALSRGPKGRLEQPGALFAAARAVGQVKSLDALCREVAVQSAIKVGVFDPLTLFVNVEPDGLEPAALDELIRAAESAPGRLRLVLEVTERALAAEPADLLASVRRWRTAGWRIALDDVGADDLSLAFMSLLRPEVIKLDLQVVQRRPDRKIAEIVTAVSSFAERTGAAIVAEGIESEAHLSTAIGLGAGFGQGWLFGRPDAHPRSGEIGHLELPPRPGSGGQEVSPFECLPEGTILRPSDKPLLIEVSHHLEQEAVRLGATSMLLTTFQQPAFFDAQTHARYQELAAQVGFVGVIIGGAAGDPLRRQWAVVVLAPHYAAALLAREITADAERQPRLFEFAVTYNRDVVEAAARTLIPRLRTNNHSGSGSPIPLQNWTWTDADDMSSA